MRIAADGSWMRWMPTGLGRYGEGLLRAMEGLLGEREMTVYYNARGGPALFAGRVRERFARMPNRTAFNQLRLPYELRRDRSDVYLGTGIVVPRLAPIPTVPVVADCLAFRDAVAKPGAEGRYWRRWTRVGVSRAAAVTAISQNTAADIEEFLGFPAARVTVVAPGLESTFFTPVAASALQRADALLLSRGVRGHFVLQVGARDPHKGGAVAARAVEILRQRRVDVSLVQTGRDTALGAGVPEGATWVGMVDDEVLRALYQRCSAVVIASSHEGFGIPVLEAMAMGRPVVATLAGALPEAGGDVAHYAPAGDPEALATALDNALHEDDTAAQRRVAAGSARAREFTWERSATRMLEVLDRVAAAG